MSTIQELTETFEYAALWPKVWVRLMQVVYKHLDDGGDALVAMLEGVPEVENAIALLGGQIPQAKKAELLRLLHVRMNDQGDELVAKRKQHEVASLTSAIVDLQARIKDLQAP